MVQCRNVSRMEKWLPFRDAQEFPHVEDGGDSEILFQNSEILFQNGIPYQTTLQNAEITTNPTPVDASKEYLNRLLVWNPSAILRGRDFACSTRRGGPLDITD